MKQPLIIATGRFGGKWLNAYADDFCGNVDMLWIDPLCDMPTKCAAMLVPRKTSPTYSRFQQNFEKRLRNYQMAFVIGGIGGKYAAHSLLQLIKFSPIPLRLFLVTPFGFEKESRINNAQRALSQIQKSGYPFHLYENDKLLEPQYGQLSIKEALEIYPRQIRADICALYKVC